MFTTKSEIFSDILKEYMQLNDLTVNVFSQRIKVSESLVGYWLQGRYFPGLPNALKVADLLGCSLDYLFGLSDVPTYRPGCANVDFADRFLLLLTQHRISKNRLAHACGISSSLLSKWLLRKSLPKIESLIKLANYFNCSLDYLVGRSDAK